MPVYAPSSPYSHGGSIPNDVRPRNTLPSTNPMTHGMPTAPQAFRNNGTAPNLAPQRPGYAVPPTRAPGAFILGDSNPGLFNQRQQPILAQQPQQPVGRLSEVIGGGVPGGSQQQQGNAGAILGSSVGAPSFYGAGLAPASGLGGGLYPSLVSLYR